MSISNVQLLLADVAIVIVLARLLGAVAKRLGQPPVLGEILAGILLGPTFFHGRITTTLFPASLIPPLTALADIGLVLFMFVVGYEVDLRLIRGRERVAASVAAGSVIVPLALGSELGVWLAHRHHLHHVSTFALFIGTAMAATAFPVLARILTDRGLHRTRIGGIALASAAIADVLAWVLLAVVVALAGNSSQWKVLLVIPYAAGMFGVVRPILRRLSRAYLRAGRLTPNVLATVLAGLLLSCYATSWMGLHFIFGAFLFGVVMPRENVGLREEILERLEQVSVLILLPLYFVVSGLSINLATIGHAGLQELGAILVVAIAGKLAGAYLGARLTGVRGRNAGVIATLMNTRGLTELVILGVGLQLHILTKPLYTLMVVMALVTTAMSGPLLNAIYPERVMLRDLAAADRAQLAGGPALRILVLIDRPETAGPLVDIGADLVASRPGSELTLAHLVPLRSESRRLEVGTGLGGELAQMTLVMGQLHTLTEQAAARGAPAIVFSRFSDDVPGELPAYVAAAEADTVVLDSGHAAQQDKAYVAVRADSRTRLVMVRAPVPAGPSAVAVHSGHGADAAAGLDVAAQLATARHLPLVLAGADSRRSRSGVAKLGRSGIAARNGPPPEGALLVAGEDGAAAIATRVHLTVRAGSGEDIDDRPEIAAPVSVPEPERQQ